MTTFNTRSTIADYNNADLQLQSEYDSLYLYCLYLCGGDFSLFDDPELLASAFHDDQSIGPVTGETTAV